VYAALPGALPEIHGYAVPPSEETREIHFDISETILLGLLARRTPQNGLDARAEFQRAERLGSRRYRSLRSCEKKPVSRQAAKPAKKNSFVFFAFFAPLR